MGFFGNLKKIGLINDKISRLEALLEEIRVDFHKRTPQGEIQAKITHGRFILSEIGEIVSSSPKSVFLAPYWLFGNKMELQQVCSKIASLLDEIEEINSW